MRIRLGESLSWAQRNETAREFYVIAGQPRTPAGVDLPLWDPSDPSRPLLIRHEMNNRSHYVCVLQYRDIILSRGIHAEGRSEFIAIPIRSKDAGADQQDWQDHCDKYSVTVNFNGMTFAFVAGATLIEAAYLAMRTHPDNPNVAFMRKRGIPNVTLLDPRTPPDGIEHFKNIQNELNNVAAAISHVECCNTVPEIEKRWKDKCTREGQERRAKKQRTDNATTIAGAATDLPSLITSVPTPAKPCSSVAEQNDSQPKSETAAIVNM